MYRHIYKDWTRKRHTPHTTCRCIRSDTNTGSSRPEVTDMFRDFHMAGPCSCRRSYTVPRNIPPHTNTWQYSRFLRMLNYFHKDCDDRHQFLSSSFQWSPRHTYNCSFRLNTCYIGHFHTDYWICRHFVYCTLTLDIHPDTCRKPFRKRKYKCRHFHRG